MLKRTTMEYSVLKGTIDFPGKDLRNRHMNII